MKKTVYVTADRVRQKKKTGRIIKISLLGLLLLLIVLYVILQVIYNEGRFTITLDYNKDLKSGLAIYESTKEPVGKRELEAGKIEFLDNISIKWLPKDIDDPKYEGAHNGPNYIAYTFYVENQGKEVQNYWYEVVMTDVIKAVDDAVRIMIYLNGERTVYAKVNSLTGKPEYGTTPFNSENPLVLEKRENFNPGDVDRFTIIIFLEGDDPDCVNAIIGGELKLQMNITDEHIRGKEE